MQTLKLMQKEFSNVIMYSPVEITIARNHFISFIVLPGRVNHIIYTTLENTVHLFSIFKRVYWQIVSFQCPISATDHNKYVIQLHEIFQAKTLSPMQFSMGNKKEFLVYWP